MKKTFLLLLFSFLPLLVLAQNVVNGKVTTAEGEMLPGVQILEKGTTNGTITDLEGNFTLPVQADGVLVVSYLGYKTEEVEINNQDNLTIVLQINETGLDEVVIVGYGVQKKSDLTGAVSTVNMDNIDKMQVSTIDQALQGQIAGVNVTSNTGSPGGSMMVRVRGIGTLNESAPLYVVDGMMVGDIDHLNSNDIESIQVLKDASATAIYGSRGSNGVVIISTKSGEAGQKPIINFNSYWGVQNFWRAAPVCNSEQWAILNNEAKRAANQGIFPELADPSSLPNTDWFKEISNKDAQISSYDLSISGGNEKSTYYVSSGYLNQDGIVNKTGFERINFRLNSTHKLRDWLTIGENLSLIKSSRTTVSEEDEWTNVLISAMNIDPVTQVYNPDGTWGSGTFNDIYNPAAIIEYTNNKDNRYRTMGNLFADFTILDGLVFKTNYSLEYSFGVADSYVPVYYVSNSQSNSISSIGKYNDNQFINQWSNTITYSKKIMEHNLTVLAGTEMYSYTAKYDGITATDVPIDNVHTRFINNARGREAANTYGSNYEEKQLSFLARINYSFANRYLLTVNFRADGSSKFPKKNQWAYFPSFSVGWKVSEESFMKNLDFLSHLKLRAGWGQIGNQGSVPAYQSITSLTSGQNYVWNKVRIPGSAFMSSGNENLKWESSTTTNVGADFGFLGGKIEGSVEYFVKTTKDMLLQVPVPAQSGLQSPPWQNAGEMKNKGFEFSASYKNMDGAFKYSVGANLSIIDNEVVSLGNGNEFIDGGSYRDNFYVTRTIPGQSMAQFYGYKTDGLYQNQAEIDDAGVEGVGPGDVKYVDADGDGEPEFYFLGSPLPDFTYALNANFMFKGFDLSLVLQGVQGNKIFNGTAYYNRSSTAYWNLNVDMLNRWTGEGTTNDARYARMNALDANNSRMSDRYIEDGSYLRIKTLQLGYTLPKTITDRVNIQKLRVYVNAQNLFTFTKYTGLDPEIGMGQDADGGRDPLNIGIDRAFYPQARLFSFGVNLTF